MKNIASEADPNIGMPTHHSKTMAELLDKLDARKQPGITAGEFSRLFGRCECGLMMTQRAFGEHRCGVEIVDLTGDD
jgi:hypothetical protein